MRDLIVFLHRGESWYLYYTVKQAYDRHPGANLVVISDVPQPLLTRYAKVVPLRDYWTSALAFESLYQHFSTNTYEFELFCFQRWFVLAEFVRKHQPDTLIHLDSDLLVYDDLRKDFELFNQADLGLVSLQGPFSLLVKNPSLLLGLRDRITRLYTDERDSLAAMYDEWRQTARETAISDMHALRTYIDQAGLRYVDLGLITNGCVYDNVISKSDGFVMEGGYKAMRWEEGKPFVKTVAGQETRLKTIHCQGQSKVKILDYFTGRDLSFLRDKITGRVRSDLGKAIAFTRGGKRSKVA